jgi:hypothetical protein
LQDRTELSLPLGSYNLGSYLAYALYAPLYIAGPISTYNGFTSQMKVGWGLRVLAASAQMTISCSAVTFILVRQHLSTMWLWPWLGLCAMGLFAPLCVLCVLLDAYFHLRTMYVQPSNYCYRLHSKNGSWCHVSDPKWA